MSDDSDKNAPRLTQPGGFWLNLSAFPGAEDPAPPPDPLTDITPEAKIPAPASLFGEEEVTLPMAEHPKPPDPQKTTEVDLSDLAAAISAHTRETVEVRPAEEIPAAGSAPGPRSGVFTPPPKSAGVLGSWGVVDPNAMLRAGGGITPDPLTSSTSTPGEPPAPLLPALVGERSRKTPPKGTDSPSEPQQVMVYGSGATGAGTARFPAVPGAGGTVSRRTPGDPTKEKVYENVRSPLKPPPAPTTPPPSIPEPSVVVAPDPPLNPPLPPQPTYTPIVISNKEQEQVATRMLPAIGGEDDEEEKEDAPGALARFIDFLNRHRVPLAVGMVVATILVLGGVVFAIIFSSNDTVDEHRVTQVTSTPSPPSSASTPPGRDDKDTEEMPDQTFTDTSAEDTAKDVPKEAPEDETGDAEVVIAPTTSPTKEPPASPPLQCEPVIDVWRDDKGNLVIGNKMVNGYQVVRCGDTEYVAADTPTCNDRGECTAELQPLKEK